ncbi:unnamed protein product [Blepharisma stoltei]|uniref:Roadblock/LAMTOR2 domain-containing protein n=1 Tax=Blepharisma stoltei TaxID=1481888 RepID=A0AAU9IM26_9CILI|nr:unnamed protein product [Blepharisma stoltei]
MLNAKALTQTLQNALSQGVDNIFLVNKEGALLASANDQDNVKTSGAIASTIWCDYEANAPSSEAGGQAEEDELNLMIIEAEAGRIIATSLGMMCLCIQGQGEIGKLIETANRVKLSLQPSFQALLAEGE